MIEDIVKQINHLGYKINQDPVNSNTWKIVSPDSQDNMFSLDDYGDKICLYRGEERICEISPDQDPFLILRHLPSNTFLDIKDDTNISINTLYDYCNAKSDYEKQRISQILNDRKINQFKDRREFAFNVFHSLKDAGISTKNENYDLSIIDIILSIV